MGNFALQLLIETIMAKCDLTFEEVNELLSYDPETGLLRWKVSRRGAKAGSVVGSPNSKGYIQAMVHRKQCLGHRLAWLLAKGSWPAEQLDHINGDRADNRLDNLRACSLSENNQNRCKNRNNTSGITGVRWRERYKKWVADIRVEGNRIHLGYFDTIEEAAAARAEAKKHYHKFQPVERE